MNMRIIIKTLCFAALMTTVAMGLPTTQQLRDKQAAEQARQQAAIAAEQAQTAAAQAAATGLGNNCADVHDALGGGPRNPRCEDLSHLANGLHDIIDGTKNYIARKAGAGPALTNGKEFPVTQKIAGMYDELAGTLVQHVIVFLERVRTRDAANNPLRPNLFDFKISNAAFLNNGGNHFNMDAANIDNDLVTLINEDLADVAGNPGNTDTLLRTRQSVLIAWYVFSILKPGSLGKIAKRHSTIDGRAGTFTEAQLKAHIAEQLWAMDATVFIKLLSSKDIDDKVAAPGAALKFTMQHFLDLIGNDRVVNGYLIHGYDRGRALASFNKLVGHP